MTILELGRRKIMKNDNEAGTFVIVCKYQGVYKSKRGKISLIELHD